MSDSKAFFTGLMLSQSIMSELAEARAKAGFCPKCQNASLRLKHIGAGLAFKHCESCGAIAVIAAPTGGAE